MVFGGTAARSSAIPTPSEGMVSYRQDVNVIDVYDGTTWQQGIPVGAWTTYTPVLTPSTGSITSYVINAARYALIGKTVHLHINSTITNNGTGSGQLNYTLPITAKDKDYTGNGLDGNNGNALSVFLSSATSVRVTKYDYTYPSGLTRISITYEAA